jgi:phage terminase large subunit-like protein
MQNPVPEEGELFSPDRIGVKATAEDVFFWVRAWDLAGTVEGDWTVGVLMGKTRKGSYVVGDVVLARMISVTPLHPPTTEGGERNCWSGIARLNPVLRSGAPRRGEARCFCL